MRSRPFAVALVSTICLGAATLIADDARADYYPLKIGTRWTCTVTTPDGTKDVTAEAAKTEKLGDDTCTLVVTKDADGTQLASEDIVARPDGLYRAAYGGAQINPPLCILKLPVKKGQTWKVASTLMGTRITATYTIDDTSQEVTVPAGKFKCVVVSSDDLAASGQPIGKIATFYADGVGMVKQTSTLNGAQVSFELTRFEPAAAGNQDALKKTAYMQIAELDTALQLYYNDNHAYPTTAQGLEALHAEPSPKPLRWQGPYVKTVPRDPWGHVYLYRFPGIHDSTGFDIWSVGPDGQDGTADDIRGWAPPPK